MFGNKNKINLEELQKRKDTLERIAREVADSGSLYEANTSAIANSQKQMIVNMNQVVENHMETTKLAEQNISMESALCQNIVETAERMSVSADDYTALVERIYKQTDSCMELVEQNKHFTSPTKYVTEAVTGMISRQQEQAEVLSRMADSGKQMEVLALNAAIEAGRMGESGKQFVSAAEEIRGFAVEMQSMFSEMKQKNEDSEKRITELQEQVHHLVGLLKDNNVAMGQLFKQNQETVRAVENSSIRPFSPDALEWKEQLVGMLNTEEEVLKLQERSRIQLEDIAAEIQAQHKASMEVSERFIPLFQKVEKYKK